jgi:hypothetical protein
LPQYLKVLEEWVQDAAREQNEGMRR